MNINELNNIKKKISTEEALLGLIGIIFLLIGGLFDLIGTSIAGGFILIAVLYGVKTYEK